MTLPRMDAKDWPNWLAHDDMKMVEFLIAHNVRNEETYEEFRYTGPTDAIAELDLKRLSHFESSIPLNDPMALLKLAPLWVRFVSVSDFTTTVRIRNVLNYNGIALVGDLLEYTSQQLLTFQSMGQKSLLDLSCSILELSRQPLKTGHFAPPPEPAPNQSVWYEKLLDEVPALLSIFNHNQITNETSYLQKRRQLPEQLRKQVDSYRYESSLSTINDYNPLDLLRIAPTWLLDMNIKYFRTSQRMKNAIREQGIITLGDFLDFDITGLYRMNNMGRTTLDQFYSDIQHAKKKGPPPTLENPLTNKLSLRRNFQNTIDAVDDEKHRYVLEKRLGIHCEAETLETIGEALGVTRERIRQIEMKLVNSIIEDEFWDDSLKFKLQHALQGKQSPVFLEELQSNDPWFDGFETEPELLKSIIRAFSHLSINFIPHDGRTILSDIRKDELDDLVRKISHNLDETTNIGYTYEDIEAVIEHALSVHNAQELTDIVFDQLSEQLHFVSKNEQLVLASVGNGLRSRLNAILQKSPSPLHFSEISKRYLDEFGETVSERSIHAALGRYDFWLFGPGEYGLLDHLPSTPDELKSMSLIASRHVDSHPDRQWHSSELLAVIEQYDTAIDLKRIDKFVLNISLHQFSDLQYLGKMIWASSNIDPGSLERILIKDAVVEALQAHGSAMSISALEREVRKKRGVPMNFETQLNAIVRVGRIAPGTWGLIYRDFEGTDIYWERILKAMINQLGHRQSALHKSELLAALKEERIGSLPKLNLVYGIVQADDRFRGWLGGFVGLRHWPSPNRLTLTEVVDELLRDGMNRFTLDELGEELDSKISYAYSPAALSIILKNHGMSLNRDNGIWSKET